MLQKEDVVEISSINLHWPWHKESWSGEVFSKLEGQSPSPECVHEPSIKPKGRKEMKETEP